ncbi:hypothetical protein Dda_6491 [Drechslerella dactyloides]|uniref:Uncharacterized protein n=1 Tax=Drechslerella dactyloides TaxID=74499 RepID=A0AAD6IVN3_DREDA|nr:hypothetical protein Dda_6491 [Drechslerella dactyloides]
MLDPEKGRSTPAQANQMADDNAEEQVWKNPDQGLSWAPGFFSTPEARFCSLFTPSADPLCGYSDFRFSQGAWTGQIAWLTKSFLKLRGTFKHWNAHLVPFSVPYIETPDSPIVASAPPIFTGREIVKWYVKAGSPMAIAPPREITNHAVL